MSIANEIQRLQTAKTDIKTAIESKGVTVGDGTIDTYAEKINEISVGGSGDYEQGYEDGKNSVIPLERYTTGIQFISLNIFGVSDLVLNLDSATTLNQIFYVDDVKNKNTTVEHITINCPNLITSMGNAFYTTSTGIDEKLKHITLNVNTQKSTTWLRAFSNLYALETIDGMPLNFSSATSSSALNGFANTKSLVDFRVVEQSIKFSFSWVTCLNLSTDTIQSIIDGLADLTGGTAQTLTLHATVGGKLTDEQKATITAKNWELVY